jgi:hypothetical protein
MGNVTTVCRHIRPTLVGALHEDLRAFLRPSRPEINKYFTRAQNLSTHCVQDIFAPTVRGLQIIKQK